MVSKIRPYREIGISTFEKKFLNCVVPWILDYCSEVLGLQNFDSIKTASFVLTWAFTCRFTTLPALNGELDGRLITHWMIIWVIHITGVPFWQPPDISPFQWLDFSFGKPEILKLWKTLSTHVEEIIIMIITKLFEKEIISALLLHLHVFIFFILYKYFFCSLTRQSTSLQDKCRHYITCIWIG